MTGRLQWCSVPLGGMRFLLVTRERTVCHGMQRMLNNRDNVSIGLFHNLFTLNAKYIHASLLLRHLHAYSVISPIIAS